MLASKIDHHAYLLIGEQNAAEVYLAELARKINFTIANNPDFFAFRVATFGIDEARQLKTIAVRRAMGERKIFFISPVEITIEAQNALLKTFEDPIPDTYFFLVVREESVLEKTLLSRMQVERMPRISSGNQEEARHFLSLSIKDRLLFSKKFVENESNIIIFVDELLSLLRENGNRESVENVFKIRCAMDNASLLPRLALEHIALVI